MRLRLVSIVAAALATAIGLYMTWLRHEGDIAPCVAGGGGCAKVADSEYSEIFGVPVSALGAIGAAVVLVCAFSGASRVRAVGAAVAIGGAAFSLYLTFLELFVIDAICQWCVASAVLMVALAIVCCWRVVRVDAGSTGPAEAIH